MARQRSLAAGGAEAVENIQELTGLSSRKPRWERRPVQTGTTPAGREPRTLWFTRTIFYTPRQVCVMTAAPDSNAYQITETIESRPYWNAASSLPILHWLTSTILFLSLEIGQSQTDGSLR